jgi:L-threonylcarbamoyladenylate synthase
VSSSPVAQAVEVLQQGGLIALPTETVYGLGADASNELAVRRIFAVKGRPTSHPLIVHLANVIQARAWTSAASAAFEKLAEAFWPGPLTLIVPRTSLASDAVTGGQDTVGLRVPSHPLALEVLHAFQGGIAAPSANRFGKISPTTAEHVRTELATEVDFILDGGPCTVGVESTIVDVSGIPRILRPGGISRESIEQVLGVSVDHPLRASEVRAPGMMASHYAPRAGLWLMEASAVAEEALRRQRDGARVVVLASPDVSVPSGILKLEVPADSAGFARALYSMLRQADALADVILAVAPGAEGLGLAIRDRLQRAAAPRTSI